MFTLRRLLQLPRLKRLLFAVTPAFVLLVTVETGLRIYGYRFSAKHLDTRIYEHDTEPGMMRTDPMLTQKAPYGQELCFKQTFPREKSPGTIRVAMVGESSVKQLGLAERLRERLRTSLGKPVEIVNFGFGTCGSERVLLSTREALEYEPDILLVYGCHNEFMSISNPATLPPPRC